MAHLLSRRTNAGPNPLLTALSAIFRHADGQRLRQSGEIRPGSATFRTAASAADVHSSSHVMPLPVVARAEPQIAVLLLRACS